MNQIIILLLLVSLQCFMIASDNSVGGGQQSNSIGGNSNQVNAADPNPLMVTEEVFFDISIGGVYVGRILFGLFGDVAPKTVLNFVTLTNGNTTSPDGVLLAYKGSIFHRTIRNFMIQGGDFTQGNGYGFLSIYGKYFPDENFEILHYGPGWLGMANLEVIKDTNGSQFYITTALTKWLDYKHTLFGVVIDGMSVVRAIENNPTDKSDRPILPVVITNCGSIQISQPFAVARAPVQG